ncbi:MAG: 30S ribosome-binding factor RbfA [Bacilli bacterium]
MPYKLERLEKNIERELGMLLLSDVKNELLKQVTITKVALTNDLSIATVYYSVYGNDEQKIATTNALIEAKGYFRSMLSKVLEVRKTPDLRFKYDESLEYGKKIDDILNNLKL